jgi:hypothetical protein
LFAGSQLLDFINDGCCSHVQKILENPPHSNAFFKCYATSVSCCCTSSVFATLPSSSRIAGLRRDKSARQGGFWFQLKSRKSRLSNQISACG